MLRAAVPADLPGLLALRDGAGADALSDPALVTEDTLRRLIDAGAVTVWDDAGHAAGFAAIDDEAIHLLVDTAQRSRGIGRELLTAACAAVKAAGHDAAMVRLPPESSAERHYRSAGWHESGRTPTDGFVLKKPL